MDRFIDGAQVFSSTARTGHDSLHAARVGVCLDGGENKYFQVGLAKTEELAEQLAANYISRIKELPVDWVNRCCDSLNPE